MRTGVRLALDWGKARIGVAACDAGAIMAYPVQTVVAGPEALRTIADLAAEYQPIEIVLGLPRDLAGQDGPAAQAMHAVADQISNALPDLPLRLVDERLTTVSASRQLSRAGRNSRAQRAIIDQAAAVALLESALQFERNTGTPAGRCVYEPDRQGRTEPE